MSDVTSYGNGGYIPTDGPIPIWLFPGEKYIKPDGTVIDPFADADAVAEARSIIRDYSEFEDD